MQVYAKVYCEFRLVDFSAVCPELWVQPTSPSGTRMADAPIIDHVRTCPLLSGCYWNSANNADQDTAASVPCGTQAPCEHMCEHGRISAIAGLGESACVRAHRRYRPSFSSDDHLHLRLLCALTFGIFSLETLGSTRLDSRDWVLGA